MSRCFSLWKPRTYQDDFFQPFHTPLENHKHSYQQVLKVQHGFRVHIGDTESLCEWLFTNDVAHTIIPLSLSRFYFPTEVSSIVPFFFVSWLIVWFFCGILFGWPVPFPAYSWKCLKYFTFSSAFFSWGYPLLSASKSYVYFLLFFCPVRVATCWRGTNVGHSIVEPLTQAA